MANKKITTDRPTLNRSGAKGVDRQGFRFRQAVDGLGRTIYYAIAQAYGLDVPMLEGADPERRAHVFELAEALLRLEQPAVPVTPPVQPVVPFCVTRDTKITLYPPTLMGGKVLAKLEPNQRPA